MHLRGARIGPALEALWAQTDLLVHTSRHETYGMVISEALARGIPAIVAGGTGVADAHRVGEVFPTGVPGALAAALRVWLTDPGLRARWREQARAVRPEQPTWAETAQIVAEALGG